MLLAGSIVAEKIYSQIRQEIVKLEEKNIQPFLATIIVGENPVSLNFIKIKKETAHKLGIDFKIYHLPGIATEQSVLELINELNRNKAIHGLIVQLPLPKSFEITKTVQAIDPQKDIDGFLGRYMSPTAVAILEILQYYQIGYKNKKIILVGHGRLVGRPLEKMLLAQGVEPIVCDSKTTDLKGKLLTGEIIISATGVAGLIKADMVSEKAIVIDAGTAESEGKVVGDVDPEVYKKVAAYSPVPGGVGPVTVACLMRNLVLAAKKS